ncbi:MAG: hypothetical protein QNK37_37120 [Acidobacteriota bacterium]|nr:hypothetical protein [Acidobacteriota bacterium]
MVQEWTEPGYQPEPLERILVIGVTQNMEYKRMFEITIAEAIQKRGGRAITSSAVGLPTTLTREIVERKVKERDIDAVLVTTLMDVDVKTSTHLGGTTGLGPSGDLYAVQETGNVLMVGSWLEETTLNQFKLTLETRLFTAEDGKLVWKVYSEVFQERYLIDTLNTFTDVMVSRLNKLGVW